VLGAAGGHDPGYNDAMKLGLVLGAGGMAGLAFHAGNHAG
jgi:hypothetical protein